MKGQTEKAMNRFSKYLEEHGKNEAELSKEEMREMIDKFNADKDYEYEEDFQKSLKSDDYLQMAYETFDEKQAIKYCKKALKLNPDNIDAETQLAVLESKELFGLMSELEKLIEKAEKKLKKEKYFEEDEGSFWLILETRPYMRLRLRYLDTLIEAGMYNKAIEEAKDIIRLNEMDNLGIRYKLAHLYAHYEMEKELLQLHKKYGSYPETQFLLPLSLLYYKKHDFKKAEQYLTELSKTNHDTKKFFKDLSKGDLPFTDFEIQFGYRPNTIEELIIELEENSYLFIGYRYYFEWGYKVLNKKK